ncbi:pilus assembly protein, partial [Methylobacterium sp. WL122]
MNGGNLQLAVGLVFVTALALGYVFLMPLMMGERRAAQRLRTISASATGSAIRGVSVNRREQVAKTLGEIEAKAKGAAKVTLELKIARAGLAWSQRTYWMMSAGLAVLVGLLVLVVSANPVAGLGGA